MTSMKNEMLKNAERKELISLIEDLTQRLKKKTDDLTTTRMRLRRSRHDVQRLKGIVCYQRGRIIELHN